MLNCDVIELIQHCTAKALYSKSWPASYHCLDDGSRYCKAEYMEVLSRYAPSVIELIDRELGK